MTVVAQKKRWYELSPDVCIVISKIEIAQEFDRLRYAKKILQELYYAGYKPNKEIYRQRLSNYEMRRWYNNNRTLFMAFEYLKDAGDDLQKSVANNVLQFINSDDRSA